MERCRGLGTHAGFSEAQTLGLVVFLPFITGAHKLPNSPGLSGLPLRALGEQRPGRSRLLP